MWVSCILCEQPHCLLLLSLPPIQFFCFTFIPVHAVLYFWRYMHWTFPLSLSIFVQEPHTHVQVTYCMSLFSSRIMSKAAKFLVLCHVTLIASRSHHILNSCGFSKAIYLMQFTKCLCSSADSDILVLQSFAI